MNDILVFFYSISCVIFIYNKVNNFKEFIRVIFLTYFLSHQKEKKNYFIENFVNFCVLIYMHYLRCYSIKSFHLHDFWNHKYVTQTYLLIEQHIIRLQCEKKFTLPMYQN